MSRTDGYAPNSNELDLERIQHAWLRYVGQGIQVPERVPGIRSQILRSWRRSQEAGANPFARKLRSLDSEHTTITLERNRPLIEVAYPYLQKFQRILGDDQGEVTLANGEGAQLRRIGGKKALLQATERRAMLNGTVFLEHNAGTNGIGLALHERSAVVVWGPEHYHSMYRDFACYATPIYDQRGALVGCLNATVSLDAYDPRTLEALVFAARGIMGELALREHQLARPLTLEEAEAAALRTAMERCGGDAKRASALLGIPLSTLYRKLAAHRISARDFR